MQTKRMQINMNRYGGKKCREKDEMVRSDEY